MSYQALYRKWRPMTFDGVVGQDAVVTTLKNQIKSDRIGHAYLFCGTRGTGKTSAAKIFARAVNCPNAAEHDGSPCNECEVCRSIASGRAMNVFEIDAASNNGVDNIRDIRDQVEYPPVTGRYKVYIIDEVHMLSTGAFNALLKTLEEPPAYVIFILATTDPQKIPATVLSRCQRYDFRRMSKADISGHLKDITGKEGVRVEEKALGYIAEAADGSMRDSLSLLDQCLAYHYGEVLTYDHVLEILGAADSEVFSKLFGCIAGHNIEGALAIVDELINSGREVSQLINDFIWYLRNVLLVKSTDSREALDISDDNYRLAENDARLTDRDGLIGIITSMAELSNRLRFSSQKRVQLEVEIIRLCAPLRYNMSVPAASAVQVSAVQPAAAQAGPAAPVRQAVSAKINIDISDSQSRAADDRPAAGKQPAAEDGSISDAGHSGTAGNVSSEAGIQPAAAASVPVTEGSVSVNAGSISETVRANWNLLISELSASNRPLFTGVTLKEERGGIVLLFKNKLNYTLAAKNSEENGLIRLRELAGSRLGLKVSFTARIAKPGELDMNAARATDEELAKINFPISIED